MEQKVKLYSGENTTSEKNNYTSYNNISNCKNNFFLKIKNKRELHLSSPQEQKNEIKTKTKLIKKNKLQTKPEIKKSFSFTYNYFKFETRNKNKSLQDKSFGIKSIRENKTTKGNFISLTKEANKYTENDLYIKNKKIQFYDINQIDNKNETSSFDGGKTNKINKNILYKTTFFRGGKFYNNKEKRKKKLIRRIERNMPIEDIVNYLEQNEDSLNIFSGPIKKRRLTKVNSFQDDKNQKINNNSLYKEIMNKNLEAIISNQLNEYEKLYKLNHNTSNNNSELNLNHYSIEDNINCKSIINKSDNDLYK